MTRIVFVEKNGQNSNIFHGTFLERGEERPKKNEQTNNSMRNRFVANFFGFLGGQWDAVRGREWTQWGPMRVAESKNPITKPSPIRSKPTRKWPTERPSWNVAYHFQGILKRLRKKNVPKRGFLWSYFLEYVFFSRSPTRLIHNWCSLLGNGQQQSSILSDGIVL